MMSVHESRSYPMCPIQEACELNPLIDPTKYRAALYEPVEGHFDPAGVTNAYAKAARKLGAKVYRDTPVFASRPRPDGTWDVVTSMGTINAEMLVNTAGLWVREVGHLAGIDPPVQPMEHHYLITETIPELRDHGKEVAVTIDYEGNAYTRQEYHGILIGTYEQRCVPWSVNGTPAQFGHELLQLDLDRIGDRLELAIDRMRARPRRDRAGAERVEWTRKIAYRVNAVR